MTCLSIWFHLIPFRIVAVIEHAEVRVSMGPFVDVHFTWFPGGSGRIGERPRGNPQGHRFGGPAFHSTLQISDLDGQIHYITFGWVGNLANNFVLRSSGVFRRQRFHRTDRKATTWSWWVNRLMTKWWLIGVNWVYSLKLWNFQVSNATCSQIANRMCKIQPMIVRSVRRQMSKMLADF